MAQAMISSDLRSFFVNLSTPWQNGFAVKDNHFPSV